MDDPANAVLPSYFLASRFDSMECNTRVARRSELEFEDVLAGICMSP